MNEKKYITGFRLGVCDKCGDHVPKENSAVLVQELATEGFAGFVLDRHLYPTGDCEGSPSRVTLVETDPAWADAYNLVVSQTTEPD
jgi:hypothetical protein